MTKIVDVHYLSRGGLDGGNHFPSYFWFSEMVMLSKSCKPGNFESHNSLNLRFTNIQCLCFKFVGCKSFLESNSSDILALYETNLKGLIDSSNIFVRVYLFFIRKDTLLKCIVLQFIWRRGLLLRETHP